MLLFVNICQCDGVRCPGHAIQFLSYGYSEYVKAILELLELDISNLERAGFDITISDECEDAMRKICKLCEHSTMVVADRLVISV